jgi:hypothetical protein
MFTVVVMFGVVAAIARLGASRASAQVNDEARFAAAVQRVDDACRAYRAVHPGTVVCAHLRTDADAPSPIPALRSAGDRYEEADAAFAAHDAAAAARALGRGLAESRDLPMGDTLLGLVVGGGIVRGGLDAIDAHADQLDARTRRALVAAAHLELGPHPLEGERLQLAWSLAHRDGEPSFAALSDAAIADAIAIDDAVFPEIEAALLAGDVPRCARAAGGVAPAGMYPGLPKICGELERVWQTAARLAAARD